MRIVLSDYSGHPFQVQLARELARRGHHVLHVSSSTFQTPKGRLEAEAGDASTFRSVTVSNRKPFNKAGLATRFLQEHESGRLIGEQIAAFAPDVVISSNAPLGTQWVLMRAARKAGARFIYWIQDLYGDAMRRILRDRLGLPGGMVGALYERVEHRMLAKSDHIVAISDDFVDYLAAVGLDRRKITTVENWAPLDEMEQAPRDNDWARANLPADRTRAIYSGTLGYKHDPDLLVELARRFDGDVLVFSEGDAASYLKDVATREGLANLQVRGWVPFETLPQVLAAGDVLMVVLEPDAGAFSVPSKVLTYLCIGRAIVGSIRGDNLAARIIATAGAGITVEPTDRTGFVDAVCAIVQDRERARAMGAAARHYAEATFAIDHIGNTFENICHSVTGESHD